MENFGIKVKTFQQDLVDINAKAVYSNDTIYHWGKADLDEKTIESLIMNDLKMKVANEVMKHVKLQIDADEYYNIDSTSYSVNFKMTTPDLIDLKENRANKAKVSLVIKNLLNNYSIENMKNALEILEEIENDKILIN